MCITVDKEVRHPQERWFRVNHISQKNRLISLIFVNQFPLGELSMFVDSTTYTGK